MMGFIFGFIVGAFTYFLVTGIVALHKEEGDDYKYR